METLDKPKNMSLEDLCNCFKEIIKKEFVRFYTTEGDNLVMPHIPKTNYRYNNCPCCGLEVRNLETTVSEVLNLRKE